MRDDDRRMLASAPFQGRLERVPRAGEEFVLGGFRVVVERVVRRRVQRVYFERLTPPGLDEDDE